MQQIEIEFETDSIKLEGLSYSNKLKALTAYDLSFIGKNGRIPLHNVHSFPAKFPPQLPLTFIKELTRENDIVLDPMMGSCTTLIEALRLKRIAYGCDIDPLSIIIAKAKLNELDVVEVNKVGKSVLNMAFKNFSNNRDKLKKEIHGYFDEKTKNFIDYWFSETTQLELFSIISQINSLHDEPLQNFLKMIFSSIIVTKSGGVSRAIDLGHTRPHISKDKTVVSAFEEFNKKFSSVLKNYIPLPNTNFEISQSDARNIPLADNSVDLIVTSPPYANNAIDYLRAHKFSLVWFGYTLESISNVRTDFIGYNSSRERNDLPLLKLSQSIVKKIEKVDPRKAIALSVYYSEMFEAIKEMHRVVKKNKAVAIVVASSIIKGTDTLTHKCLAEIGTHNGFNLIGINRRLLDRDRRMMPARWRRDVTSQIESRMHEEFVIIFQK